MKTATTLDQYSGLNCSGVSTMMKRIGRAGSIEGMKREICKIEAEELDVELAESAGINAPPSRNDLMFDMRRIDDADGERSMIGSGRRAGVLRLCASDGLFDRCCAAGCEDLRERNGDASFRT